MKKLLQFIIILFIITLGLVIIKTSSIVPLPDYLPKDKNWKLEEKHSNKGIFNRHVYCRYNISHSSEEVEESLKNVINQLFEWESAKEMTSVEVKKILDEEVEERYSYLKREPDLFEEWYESKISKAVAPALGDKYAIPTQKPFILLKYYRHGPATHYYINTRIIENDNQSCILELWDYQQYDH